MTMPAPVPTSAHNSIRIRRHRLKAKLSLRQLASRLGISAPYLHDLENGRRKLSVERRKQITSAIRMAGTRVL